MGVRKKEQREIEKDITRQMISKNLSNAGLELKGTMKKL